MEKLKEVVTEALQNENELVLWLALPIGILHAKIDAKKSHEEDGFWVKRAYLLQPHDKKLEDGLFLDEAHVIYAHVAAWGDNSDPWKK